MPTKKKMSKREMKRLRTRQIITLAFAIFIIIAMIGTVIAPAFGTAF